MRKSKSDSLRRERLPISSDTGSSSRRLSGAYELADSAELVRLLLDSTGEGVYGIDLRGNCTFANPACLRLLGFESDQELLGRNIHELVHHTRPNGEPYPIEECRIYRAFRAREGTHLDDEVMFRKDGARFPAEYWSYPMERDGELVGCVVTFVDITERRRHEQLLADQRAALAELARFPEMNPGPVFRLDLDAVVRMANAAAIEVFGDDLVGACWRETCPDIDDTEWRRILNSTGPVALERRIGEREFVFHHRRGPQGKLVFVFGADVTEMKEAQRALRQADELVRLLLDSTGEGIYGVDLRGNCTFANPACLKLLGFESDQELLGRNMHELVHHTRPNGEPYPIEECRIYRAFRAREGTHVDDEVMFRKDGARFPAEYWSYPMERDGELVGCVVTFVDITERRRVEEELRQTEKMAALGKLSAGVAHELNNPAAATVRAADQLLKSIDGLQSTTSQLAGAGLAPDHWNALVGFYRELCKRSANGVTLSPLEASDREDVLVEWLESHGVNEAWEVGPALVTVGVQSSDLDSIVAELPHGQLGDAISWVVKTLGVRELAGTVARGSRSISALVDAVRSHSHMDRAPIQNVDIHDGLENTITILKHKLKRGIEVVREYDRELPEIEIRASELNQVWTNLIDNAIGALGETGTITIRTYRDDNRLTVEIADDGPGIPAEIQPRVFDPFFTTKEVREGTGLGLDIVRRIVTERCKGHVDFRSREGETVFRVRLPLE